MRVPLRILLAALCVVVVVAGPLYCAYQHNTHFRNFHVVDDGILYRSGQLSPEAFDQVLRERKIHTVISLRTSRVPGKLPPDTWEEEYCARRGVQHVRIVPQIWGADEEGDVPAEQAVREFLHVMDDPKNYPVLVHCFAGKHRTGTMCAVYRMEHDHWTSDSAINEITFYGFDPLDLKKHIEGYLRAYIPRWRHN